MTRSTPFRLLLSSACCLLVCGLAGVAPGAQSEQDKDKQPPAPKKPESKTAIVPFGDVVVNLVDERQQRYLRIKLALEVDAAAEKDVTDLVAKKRAAVKSAFIGHLAGKSAKDVSGAAGVKQTQKELLERAVEVLYPEGKSPLRTVLFEEYVIQ